MSPLIRTIRDLRAGLTSIMALLLILTACVLAFVHPGRSDLIGQFLLAGSALLADPGRHGRATDPPA